MENLTTPAKVTRTSRVSRKTTEQVQIFGAGKKSALMTRMLAKAKSDNTQASTQETYEGRVTEPVNFELLKQLRWGNTHHASCILAKVNATVGLGFKSEQVEEILGPLTRKGFEHILTQTGADFEDCGNGYLEVVRRDGLLKPPTGIHYLRAETVHIIQEPDSYEYHYEVDQAKGPLKKLPAYGDKARYMEDVEGKISGSGKRDEKDVAEIIHFSMPNGVCDKFGVPDWLAALPLIDMVQTQQQYWYDYFQNWGSVAKFLSITSDDEIDDAVWTDIESAFTSTGKGDGSFKTFVANLVGQNISVQVHDLGGDPFTGTAIEADRNLALDIGSSHRTPPSLAHIVPSAKAISSNKGVLREEVDAWQAMVIGQRQRVFTKTLERTLGQDFKMKKVEKTKQEVSGVTQEMVVIEESGWTLNKLRDEMEFDMSPQLGGPQSAGDDENGGTDTGPATKPTVPKKTGKD